MAKFNECFQRAKKGSVEGERCLIGMLEDPGLRTGIRGLAAAGLGRVKSVPGHATLRATGEKLLQSAASFGARSDSVGMACTLVRALADYRDKADLPLALRLADACGTSLVALDLSVYGDPSAQPLLSAARDKERNAYLLLALNLALARCGDLAGTTFVRSAIRNSVTAPPSAGQQIDFYEENPLSGRLTGELEADLGGVPSDEQFRSDLLWVLQHYPCENCLAAWAPIARIGTAGIEDEIIAIAVSKNAMQDDAIKALVYNGALAKARRLGSLTGREENVEAFIRARQAGTGGDWFRGRSRAVE
jgi:hypothetical protein